MLKKAGILFCLLVFTFQAVLFNGFLYGFILTVKLDEGKYAQGLQSMSLSQDQYKKLQWLNKDEFSFGKYLIDVKEEKKSGDKIILSYKVDLKEKDFLEKLIEHARNSKNKKAAGFAFPYKVTEPDAINFSTQITTVKYNSHFVSILEAQPERFSPPPKA